MKALTKLLLLGGAGLAAYGLVRRLEPVPVDYYRDKAAVVTGGASGIGRALVEALVARGARVLAVDMNADGLARLAGELPEVETIQMDLTAERAPHELLERALGRLADIDLFFSNAGVVWAASFLAMSEADIRRLIDVNYTMQVLMTRELLPYFLARGSGVIAYTGSLSSYVYSPFHSVYTGTKGGLNNFVASVRRELPAGSGVQLTIVHPNMTRTSLVPDDLFEEVAQIYPLQTPEQVAAEFLDGVAIGRKQVFIELSDHALMWAERLAPWSIDQLFTSKLTEELKEKAETAMRRPGSLWEVKPSTTTS